jgi:hypothetical protein
MPLIDSPDLPQGAARSSHNPQNAVRPKCIHAKCTNLNNDDLYKTLI